MLIVITQDPEVRAFCQSASSNAVAWGSVFLLSVTSDQSKATAEFASALAGLTEADGLYIVAHGNDDEIGDDLEDGRTWGWTAAAIADLLAENLTVKPGVIVFDACGGSVSTFSTKVALALEQRPSGSKKLEGASLYGRNTSTSSSFPSPKQVATSVDLQPVVVG